MRIKRCAVLPAAVIALLVAVSCENASLNIEPATTTPVALGEQLAAAVASTPLSTAADIDVEIYDEPRSADPDKSVFGRATSISGIAIGPTHLSYLGEWRGIGSGSFSITNPPQNLTLIWQHSDPGQMLLGEFALSVQNGPDIDMRQVWPYRSQHGSLPNGSDASFVVFSVRPEFPINVEITTNQTLVWAVKYGQLTAE